MQSKAEKCKAMRGIAKQYAANKIFENALMQSNAKHKNKMPSRMPFGLSLKTKKYLIGVAPGSYFTYRTNLQIQRIFFGDAKIMFWIPVRPLPLLPCYMTTWTLQLLHVNIDT